jgi:hypothetical protein
MYEIKISFEGITLTIPVKDSADVFESIKKAQELLVRENITSITVVKLTEIEGF